jgi:DNA-binding XRE family transcriptional regulator
LAHFNALHPVIFHVLAHYIALVQEWPSATSLLSYANEARASQQVGLRSGGVNDMSLEERKAYIQAVADEVARGKLTLGGAVKRLRENLLGLNQERFATACKISKRALSQLEVDNGNPTLATLDAVFRKFGLKISLTHLSPVELNAADAQKNKTSFGISAK